MVEFETIEEDTKATAADQVVPEPVPEHEPKPSEERLQDAEAIEAAARTINRPTARAHLESLAQKLRRDAAALKRVEASRARAEAASAAGDGDAAAAPAAFVPAPKPPPSPAPLAAKAAAASPAVPASARFTPIDKFSFDAGGYDSDRVTLYIPLPGVGSIPRDNVTCTFTPGSFDLIVRDLNGKHYRLFKDNLEKDIDPEKSKRIVKADKIVLRLGKCKGEYGSYDHWQDLTSKKPKKRTADGKATKEDPAAGIMDMMKNMYDEGDDNMKKMIGETMWKQRTGQLDSTFDKDKYGMGGIGEDDF